MKDLNKENKLLFILENVKKYSITAYEIGTNTELNISGIDRVLDGTTKNPQKTTVNIIYDYINNKYVTPKKNQVNEENSVYNSNNLPCEEKLLILEKEIGYKDEIIQLQKEQIQLLKDSK